MRDILLPGVDGIAFLQRAVVDGYSMQNPFVDPAFGEEISQELREANLLRDMVELELTSQFNARGMRAASLLHSTLNRMVCQVEGIYSPNLPYFSVRVFQPGRHGTTVHRNDPCVGPWAIGVTLKGEAPFNVYGQDQLPEYTVRPLVGDESDPVPLDTMTANAGAAWTLYTAEELVPHSSGIVDSDEPRELLLFYNTANYRRFDP